MKIKKFTFKLELLKYFLLLFIKKKIFLYLIYINMMHRSIYLTNLELKYYSIKFLLIKVYQNKIFHKFY